MRRWYILMIVIAFAAVLSIVLLWTIHDRKPLPVEVLDWEELSKPQYIGKPVVVPARYDTTDIPIASYVVSQFGSKGDGRTDDTAAFQAAMDKASSDGGGVVYVPSGVYAFHGTLNIPTGVTLRGEWNNPEDSDQDEDGTLFLAYSGRGDEEGIPFITMQPSSGLRGAKIWYPEQTGNTFVPYPWTIKQASGMHITVQNVTLVNPYLGIRIGPEWNELHYINQVYGTPLKQGIAIDFTTDIGRLEDIHFSPRYWLNSGLEGTPDKQKLDQWLWDHAEAIVMGRTDWQYSYNISIENYGIGLKVNSTLSGKPNAQFSGLNIRNAREGIQLSNANEHGVLFSNSTIHSDGGKDTVGINIESSFNTVAQFNQITINGTPDVAVKMSGTGVATFSGGRFEGWSNKAIEQANGTLTVENSAFVGKGTHALIQPSIQSSAFLGNTYEGRPVISSLGVEASKLLINEERRDLTPNKPMEHKYIGEIPKPQSNALFNVKDYGAAGDGLQDDTEAINTALHAAGQDKGTVYLPAGTYKVLGELTVPSGVELRGTFDVPHHSQGNGSILLAYSGKGNESSKPFISLKSHSGVRGVTIFYPEQRWKEDPFAYPWTIQGLGEGVWAKDVVLTNSYQGIDFGTHPSKNHYISYVSGAPLRKGIFVGNNSGEGWIENVQFNPHYFFRSGFAGAPTEEDWTPLWEYQIQHLDAITFGNNQQEHVLGTFVFGSNKGLYFVSQNRKGTNAVIIGHGTDGSNKGIVVEGGGKLDFMNTQLVVMGKGGDKEHIVVAKDVGSDADITFHNSSVWGYADRSIQLSGGKVTLRQTNFYSQGDAAIYADGGELLVTNSYFQQNSTQVKLESGILSAKVFGNVGKGSVWAKAEIPLNVENHAGDKAEIGDNIGIE
ncbi:hypothetical protein Back11_50160 [Paenibacillus baekrokdamisoli]|uniref:Rhamnogalacturonase A/B/Epimerase-like pectate lyase domain-containing protein n=1 Tax=Paenibacillus baekrokdamisoli TaxID=1712516 RepID=A0A3G9JCJ6_9BACL|nr:glycosyl hydrolase family 28-related protein [Paenibacillus baekrokdamisoli]MBB3068845.1 hypothetical protein [Paenibacillus baekrokdamisoli]BBH23671.1 hypothetical protein Back11_50160 [Paenibacillus baekrokdamisoli]